MKHLANNRGAALLTAIITAALASFLAVRMMTSQQIEIRRTANIIHADQAYIFAIGLEEWAGNLLVDDARKSNSDYPGEPWSGGLMPLPVQGGKLNCRIIDLQSRFNLNNLLADNRQFRIFSRQQFKRLLSFCSMSGQGENIFQWLNSRDKTFKFISPGDILAIPGFSNKNFSDLAPFICALPMPTLLNINTATPRLIASLADNINLSEAKDMAAERPATGYKNVIDFRQANQRYDRDRIRRIKVQYLTVSSQYFMVKSAVNLGRGHIRLTSILNRSASGYQVIIHSLGSI